MTSPWRVRLVLTAQILVWISAGFCFYYYVSSAMSIPRSAAETRLGRPLPTDWERVFIDHGVPQNWPHDGAFKTRCGFGFLLALVLIGVCEWRLYRMNPKGGWLYRILTWTARRRAT
jgi:hypothetical protein